MQLGATRQELSRSGDSHARHDRVLHMQTHRGVKRDTAAVKPLVLLLLLVLVLLRCRYTVSVHVAVPAPGGPGCNRG